MKRPHTSWDRMGSLEHSLENLYFRWKCAVEEGIGFVGYGFAFAPGGSRFRGFLQRAFAGRSHGAGQRGLLSRARVDRLWAFERRAGEQPFSLRLPARRAVSVLQAGGGASLSASGLREPDPAASFRTVCTGASFRVARASAPRKTISLFHDIRGRADVSGVPVDIDVRGDFAFFLYPGSATDETTYLAQAAKAGGFSVLATTDNGAEFIGTRKSGQWRLGEHTALRLYSSRFSHCDVWCDGQYENKYLRTVFMVENTVNVGGRTHRRDRICRLEYYPLVVTNSNYPAPGGARGARSARRPDTRGQDREQA